MSSVHRLRFAVTAMLALQGVSALADAGGNVDSGDTAWVLVSAALVMLMTPGLGLFYGGMVRRKNVLGTILHSFVMSAIVGVQWVLIGYSLAFGPDKWHVIGSLDWLGLRNVGLAPNADYSATIPHQAFMIYQGMFAVITPALITGAFAERMSFKAFMALMVLWATFVYDPVCHWVWAPGGWLRGLGALDFAGGTVVHVSSGIAALAAVLVVGKRYDYGKDNMKPHNLTMTILGAAMLWFGWFGFNAGSALSADGLAVNAFVTTNTAAASAALSWLAVEWAHRGKPTALGMASGAVAGLVAITPASGFVGPVAAIATGCVAGALCQFAVMARGKLGYDDSLDVVGVHGVGGTWGALATGLFASRAINPAGADGLLYGNFGLVTVQLIAIGVVILYSFIATTVLLRITSLVFPLRVSYEEEEAGLDLTQHGEIGYAL